MTRQSTPLIRLVLAGFMLVSVAAHADEHADVDKLFAAGQWAEAVQKADQFLASNPRDARMRFVKGLALSEQGRSADAIAVFVKLTEDFPELPEPHNNLAVLYSKQGQYEQARRALESAIRTNPSYATAYENLGDVYAKLASQAYSKALQVDSATTTKVSPKLAMIRDLFSPKATALASAGTKPAPATTKPAPPTIVAAAPAPKPTPAAPPPAATPAPTPTPTPAPAAPAPAAKPPVVAAAPAPATPAPTPAPAAATTAGSAQDVQAAVQAWAGAWSRKDMNGYIAAYTPEFSGGKSRKAWEEERRARIQGKKTITVGLSDFQTQVQGNKAVIHFRQNYAADNLKVSGRKTLELVNVSGRWLIQKESTGS